MFYYGRVCVYGRDVRFKLKPQAMWKSSAQLWSERERENHSLSLTGNNTPRPVGQGRILQSPSPRTGNRVRVEQQLSVGCYNDKACFSLMI